MKIYSDMSCSSKFSLLPPPSPLSNSSSIMVKLSPTRSMNSLPAHEAAMVRRRRLRNTFIVAIALFALFHILHVQLSPFLDDSDSDSDSAASPFDVRVVTEDAPLIGSHFNLPRYPELIEQRQLAVVETEPNRSLAASEPEEEDAAVDSKVDQELELIAEEQRRLASEPEEEDTVAAESGVDQGKPEPEEPVGILFPDWEVFLVADPSYAGPGDQLHCVFQNNATSPARFAGVLPFANRNTFFCVLPNSVRRLRPFYQPTLTKSPHGPHPVRPQNPSSELLRWTFLAYETFSTEDDVVLFVKGVNNRQGVNRPPSEFNCVFFVGDNNPSRAIKTPVTSSGQEVFRCPHPELTPAAEGGGGGEKPSIKISLEIAREKQIIPSVAYYAPHRASNSHAARSLVCATTMVRNVAKFLPEWVTYHSHVGVETFVLYDNGSDDDLADTVDGLNKEGFDVRTITWPWQKSQEAGFSHSAVYHKDSCKWMMYIDVDEYIYAPSWDALHCPSKELIQSTFLPRNSNGPHPVGQVSVNCNEFGPSGQKSHPVQGVIHGYTCRRRFEQRHKSILRLDAVDHSLLNAIHHFKVSPAYRTRTITLDRAVVNHYKYQAWPEFVNKFKRRVSAYVVDWTQAINPMSKDRTPGLGFEAVQPKDWADKFCEVTDDRLKLLTHKWFATKMDSGYRMPW